MRERGGASAIPTGNAAVVDRRGLVHEMRLSIGGNDAVVSTEIAGEGYNRSADLQA
jgi:hypothetical protein